MAAGCAMHGEALTHGCPGCIEYQYDLAIAEVVNERLSEECAEHMWVQIDDEDGCHVYECDLCGALRFSGGASLELLLKHLSGGQA